MLRKTSYFVIIILAMVGVTILMVLMNGVDFLSLRNLKSMSFQLPELGTSYDVIKKIPRVVGIAGGHEKYQAILGAIQGKVINTLITDQQTARKLLEEG